jgi:hypothetical protein
MPLIDLKTDLKSLKYGSDRPGGGNSGQPFITSDPSGKTTLTVGPNNVLKILGINSIPAVPNLSVRLGNSKIGRFVNDIATGDSFIRGGALGSIQHSVNDALRIGGFLTTLPTGPLFIAKQVGLQLSTPKLEVKKGLGGIADGALSPGGLLGTLTGGLLGPTRVYNLGINTLAQVPSNAFGIHFNRHGIGPIQNEDTKYEAVVRFNNETSNSRYNRLVEYKNKFKLGDSTANRGLISPKTAKIINTVTAALGAFTGGAVIIPKISPTPGQLIIDDYLTGPGSVYGIGRTKINRYDLTGDGFRIQESLFNSTTFAGKSRKNNDPESIDYSGATGDKSIYQDPKKSIATYGNGILTDLNEIKEGIDKATYNTTKTTDVPLLVDSNNKVSSTPLDLPITNPVSIQNASYQKYQKIINSKKLKETTYTVGGTQVNSFGLYGNNNRGGVVGRIGGETLPDSTAFPIYYNGKNVIKLNKNWKDITRENRVGSGKQDQINLTPLFTALAGTIDDDLIISGKQYKINDLVKFRIQAINGDNPSESTYMIFRAYLTQLSDNTDSTWNPVKYAGRGEDFYIYGGFSRKINIGFKVAALSSQEMEPMYQKLNYLMSNLMPDYNNTLMRGPLVKMTVGNWIDGQTGILNNVSYTIPQDAPWEIAINEPITGEKILILPHVVEVSLTFTPIGSQTKGENKISEKSYSTSHIAQNVNESKNQYIITGSIGTAGPLPRVGIESQASTTNRDTSINNQFFTENAG